MKMKTELQFDPTDDFHSYKMVFSVVKEDLIVIKKYLTYIQNLSFLPRHKKVAGYYVIPSELLSVCPSGCPPVRLSVRPSAIEHSCPLHNFDTVRDNFTKLGPNKKHDQTTCRDLKASLHLRFLRNYSPLKFSV